MPIVWQIDRHTVAAKNERYFVIIGDGISRTNGTYKTDKVTLNIV